jgi:hypothetical protein
MFSISGSVRADVNRLPEKSFERSPLAMCGPQLEFGIAVRAYFEEIVLAPIVKFEFGHHLRVAAFETFGQAQQCGQHANHSPIVTFQIVHPFV